MGKARIFLGSCLAAPSWIRKYALLAARSTVSSPHIMPKTHLFSSSSNKALLFCSVRKGCFLLNSYWLDGIASAASQLQAIRAPLSSSASQGLASSGKHLSIPPVRPANQNKWFSGPSVVNQPGNWKGGWSVPSSSSPRHSVGTWVWIWYKSFFWQKSGIWWLRGWL